MRFIAAVLRRIFTYLKGSAKDRAMIFATLYGIFLFKAIGAFATGTQGEFVYYAILVVLFDHLTDKNFKQLWIVSAVPSGQVEVTRES